MMLTIPMITVTEYNILSVFSVGVLQRCAWAKNLTRPTNSSPFCGPVSSFYTRLTSPMHTHKPINDHFAGEPGLVSCTLLL